MQTNNMTPTKHLATAAAILILFIASSAHADEAAAKKIAPFLDVHTLFVAHADIGKFDLESFFPTIEPLLSVLECDDLENSRTALKAAQAALLKIGVRDIYIVYGSADFADRPALLFAAVDKLDARLVAQTVKAVGIEGANETIGEFVCVGGKDAIARLKNCRPVERRDLIAPLAGAEKSAVEAVFSPGAEFRKIFAEIAPELPAELGGGPTQLFTRNFVSASLIVTAPPQLGMSLVVEASDKESAANFEKLLKKLVDAVAAEMIREVPEHLGDNLVNIVKRWQALAAPKVSERKVQIEFSGKELLADFGKLLKGVPNGADRARSTNNMKQMLLALHNYHDAYGHFPTDIRDKDGKPLLSWRVQLLPFIEQQALFQEFKLNEPWDSEHNKKLVERMPKTLRSPRQAADLKNRTTYLAPIGKGYFWDSPKGTKITEITDGTSNTIALVESDDEHAVVWSKPDDLAIDPKAPLNGLLGHYSTGFVAGFADGSVRFVSKKVTLEDLLAMFTRAGGEVLGPSAFK